MLWSVTLIELAWLMFAAVGGVVGCVLGWQWYGLLGGVGGSLVGIGLGLLSAGAMTFLLAGVAKALFDRPQKR